MKKTYSCERWPFLRIRGAHFRDGIYQTDDEEMQDLIENNMYYGAHIHWTNAPEEIEDGEEDEPVARRGPGRPPGSGARQGARDTANLQ